MTLILASVIGDRFWAISDILLSRPGPRPDLSADLPLHYQALSIATPSHTLVGTAQKAILVTDQILVQWAGSPVFGQAVARAIGETVAAGRRLDIPALLLDPSMGADAQLDSALIISVLAPGDLVARFELRTRKADGGLTLYAGTGAFNFLDDVETVLTPQGLIDDRATDRWYARLALVLAEEFYFHEPLQYAYGGWHEIVRATPAGFCKAAYLVKFWTLKDGELTSGPVFTAWYVDQHLCILGATGGNGPQARSKLAIVPAWNRPPIDEATALTGFEQAYFQMHVVHQDGAMKFFWAPNPWPDGFGVALVEDKPRITIGREVLARVLSDDQRVATMSRPSEAEF